MAESDLKEKGNKLMREVIFKKIMKYLEEYPDHFLSRALTRIEIQLLLLLTAKGFGIRGKCIIFSRYPLMDYASFSRKCMEKCHSLERRRNLYRESYKLGKWICSITAFRDPDDRKRLVFLLYRNIGIIMTGDIPGQICIPKCYFSREYSADQCRWISAMDAGIIAGICGKGKLVFTERKTQGCQQCRAQFTIFSGVAL